MSTVCFRRLKYASSAVKIGMAPWIVRCVCWDLEPHRFARSAPATSESISQVSADRWTLSLGPKIVALAAGEINTGGFDDFETLIPIAKEHGAWVHVDWAFGLMARACSSKRALVSGVELADSWATDGHKWLNVPYDSGIAFVRDHEAHRSSMTISASYITPDKEARDQIDWNPEWSRRARGFPIYAALLELGQVGLYAMIQNSCEMAAALVDGLAKLPQVEVLWRPTLNQGLIRVLESAASASENDHDCRTDDIMRQVNATGEAYFSGTTWQGKRAIRISVVNWRTTHADVERTINAFESVLL